MKYFMAFRSLNSNYMVSQIIWLDREIARQLPHPIERESDELQILEVRSLDRLKDKIFKVIVVVLVVSFFKRGIAIDASSVTELLYLAQAILLISASGYLLRSIHES